MLVIYVNSLLLRLSFESSLKQYKKKEISQKTDGGNI